MNRWALEDFYRVMYPDRANRLSHISSWLNRSHYCGNESPLLLWDNNRIIGHGGRIPFHLQLGRQKLLASWFVDFAVHPSFQGKGFGKKLTQEWMHFGDVVLAIGGYENSFSLFRKLGWIESLDSHLLYFLVNPFDHPKLAGRLPYFAVPCLNACARLFFQRKYKKWAKVDRVLVWHPLDEKKLSFFPDLHENQEHIAEPLRNQEYRDWRLLSSPDREKYFVVGFGDISEGAVLVKKRDDKVSLFLDILWISRKPELFDFLSLIAALGKWCCENRFSYLRYYTTCAKTVKILKPLRPIVRHPRLAFFAKNSALFEKLKKCRWHLELMDSDFEFV